MESQYRSSDPPSNQQTRAASVVKAFRDAMGRDPVGVWAAPGRVNLIGEHTDYNDGYVLPFAILHSAFVAVAPRTDGVVRLVSAQSGQFEIESAALAPGKVTGWPAYLAGAVWALRVTHGVDIGGLDLLLDSDVPSGAGVSSSAALECATAIACAELAGATLSRQELAMVAHKAEVEMAGVPCGTMDQTVSMCAEADHALFLDCRTREQRMVPLELERSRLTTLVINTQAPHRLVGGEYAARRRDCESAARALGVPALRDATVESVEQATDLSDVERRRARHVVGENARVLATVKALSEGQPERVGPLLDASHASLRDDFQVTVPELDVAAETAVEAGALGARMFGGGFGGSVLALVRVEEAHDIFRNVAVAFERRRFVRPSYFLARPSAGARRVL